MSKLDQWKSKLKEPQSSPMFNLLARVNGYSDDGKSMLVSVVGGNKLYSGPDMLSVALSENAGPNAMLVESMANPEDQAYKKPGENGAVVEIRGLQLTGGETKLDGHSIAEAKALFFKNFLSRTDIKNQATIYPDTKFHTSVEPSRAYLDSEGQERLTRARQTTSVYITSESKRIDSLGDLESMIESHCQGRLPGRNIPGVLLQGSLDGQSFSFTLDPGLVKEQQNINGEIKEFYRPRLGKEALDFFKQQKSWGDINGMVSDNDITVVAVPSIISSASHKELEISNNFDENGQLTAKGQAIYNQNHTVDGQPLLSKGICIYRAVGSPNEGGSQPMRLHSTMPYAPGYERYDNITDRITTEHFQSKEPTPESIAMVISRQEREKKLAATQKNAPAKESKPTATPVPKEVEQASAQEVPADMDVGPEDDFNPDMGFDDELMPDFGDQAPTPTPQPQPVAQQEANADDVIDDFDDTFDFSDELDELPARSPGM